MRSFLDKLFQNVGMRRRLNIEGDGRNFRQQINKVLDLDRVLEPLSIVLRLVPCRGKSFAQKVEGSL